MSDGIEDAVDGVVRLCTDETEIVVDETGMNGFELIESNESMLLSLISGLYIASTSCK